MIETGTTQRETTMTAHTRVHTDATYWGDCTADEARDYHDRIVAALERAGWENLGVCDDRTDAENTLLQAGDANMENDEWTGWWDVFCDGCGDDLDERVEAAARAMADECGVARG
jgi:hypothetical protein